MIESEQPEPPAWLIPDSDAAADGGAAGVDADRSGARGSGSRQTLLLVGGGAVILVLVAGLAAFGLYSASTDTARPRPRSAAGDPLVLVPSADPSAGPADGAAPTAGAGASSGVPAKSAPAVAKTTVTAPAKAQVTAASITIEPASATGLCPRSTRYIQVTMKVTITVSVTDVRLRYTVDGGKELGTVMRSRTYTDSWEANAKRAPGTVTSVLKVTAPSGASDTATFKYTCS